MLPLSPQEEQDLRAFSLWNHYHGSHRQGYIDRTRLALKGWLYLLTQSGAQRLAHSVTNQELADIIRDVVLVLDAGFTAYLRSKSHLPFGRWAIVRDSFSRMMVADARADILAGL